MRHHRHRHRHAHRLHHRHHRLTLHRMLFWASFASIGITAAVVLTVMGATAGDHAWWREMERFERFASVTLARTWDDAPARDRMLDDAARTLEMHVVLEDRAGTVLFEGGPDADCRGPGAYRVDVARGGEALGRVVACRQNEHSPPWRGALALGAVLTALWGVSAIFARRAARPIRHLVDVARRIGEGDLRARPRVGPRSVVEVRALADALAEMADRIEQQLKDQRALLAGASHEMRTPLGHLRILVELLRQNASERVIDDVEREVVEMDALVEKLLASSRLDFAMADKRDVDAADLARRALERAGEPAAKLVVAPGETRLRGDPTLLLGALGNLVENARSHGVALAALTVEPHDDAVVFFVDDEGPGFSPGDKERAFEPFFHKAAPDKGSLGLGLSLVKRIAEAHGGRAFAENRAENRAGGRGARVGFSAARLDDAG